MRIENRVDRIAESKGALRALSRAGLGALLVAMIIWIVDALDPRAILSNIRWFAIKQVRVETEWPLAEATVRKWLAGVEGKSLLFTDWSTLIAEVERKPWVGSVTISRNYPDTLSVRVRTKRPVAIFRRDGVPFFLDAEGVEIERVTSAYSQRADLPVVTVLRQSTLVRWEMRDAVQLLERVRKSLDKSYVLSELVLESYPYFRVYLASPKVEVLFSDENWESQVPSLVALLNNPPSQLRQIARINLVFPKKAVVSSSLSN